MENDLFYKQTYSTTASLYQQSVGFHRNEIPLTILISINNTRIELFIISLLQALHNPSIDHRHCSSIDECDDKLLQITFDYIWNEFI